MASMAELSHVTHTHPSSPLPRTSQWWWWSLFVWPWTCTDSRVNSQLRSDGFADAAKMLSEKVLGGKVSKQLTSPNERVPPLTSVDIGTMPTRAIRLPPCPLYCASVCSLPDGNLSWPHGYDYCVGV
jgi:hypothetical protein